LGRATLRQGRGWGAVALGGGARSTDRHGAGSGAALAEALEDALADALGAALGGGSATDAVRQTLGAALIALAMVEPDARGAVWLDAPSAGSEPHPTSPATAAATSTRRRARIAARSSSPSPAGGLILRPPRPLGAPGGTRV
jgi:hypothetical protein